MNNTLWILALILELVAVCFLVFSMDTVFRVGESNWYLPVALGLSCIAMFLNLAARKNRKRKDGQTK